MQHIAESLDPLQLLDQIRQAQRQLVLHSDGGHRYPPSTGKDDLTRFLASLSTAWHQGEVRPTHRPKAKASRHWRTRTDPFENVWPNICEWLENDPDLTGKCLFKRLQREYPGVFPDGQLRTLQRRLKAWRNQMAHRLVTGVQINTDKLHQVQGDASETTQDVLTLSNIVNEARG